MGSVDCGIAKDPCLPAGFVRITCYPVYPSSVYITWVLGGAVDPGDYRFKIYRSGSPEGPFDAIANLPIPVSGDYPNYRDEEQNLLSKYRELYYYIEAVSGRGTVYTSPVKNLVRVVERTEYITAMEINRQEMLLLRQYSGVQVHVFKRKYYGETCSCFDTQTNTVLVKNCPSCLGTRYVGGYWNGIKTYANFSPDVITTSNNAEFKIEPRQTQAWMTAYPLVRDDDLLVEVDTNRRWVIRQVQNTELRRFPVKQNLLLSELPRSDVEYSIMLDYCISCKPVLNEIPDHDRPPPTIKAGKLPSRVF